MGFLDVRIDGNAPYDIDAFVKLIKSLPIIGNEASEYGYEDENRSFIQSFLAGEQPWEDFNAGLEVTELLMTAYMSAEQERTIEFKPDGLEEFIPAVARGSWRP